MASARRFRVRLQRKLDAHDHAALEQAGIELAQPTASDSSADGVLLLHAAEQDEAALRIRAALGGREELDVRSVDS